MNQQELRNRLKEVTTAGLSAASISKATKIKPLDLSRFKNEQIGLIELDAERLEKFLSAVYIPTSVD